MLLQYKVESPKICVPKVMFTKAVRIFRMVELLGVLLKVRGVESWCDVRISFHLNALVVYNLLMKA
jgi:hypothetical protein